MSETPITQHMKELQRHVAVVNDYFKIHDGYLGSIENTLLQKRMQADRLTQEIGQMQEFLKTRKREADSLITAANIEAERIKSLAQQNLAEAISTNKDAKIELEKAKMQAREILVDARTEAAKIRKQYEMKAA